MAGDLVIASRRVVVDGAVRPAAVRIRGERIAAVEPWEGAGGAAGGDAGGGVIDVGDLVVMPGVIDAHVHVNEPGRTEWEGFATAGRAAAAGGVTTIVVMPLNCTPAATTVNAIEGEARAAAGVCSVDFGFWGGVVPGNVAEIEAMWRMGGEGETGRARGGGGGVLGYKCFLVPSGVADFQHVGEKDLRGALPLLARLGSPLLVHAEDPAVIAAAGASDALAKSPRSYAAYLATRPAEAETRAIEMMIRLARELGARVHIVHVAAAEALAIIGGAKREGVRITCETCPHYLTFAAEEIDEGGDGGDAKRRDGRTEFKCAPPIRGRAHREALWQGLRDGTIEMVASDHSPCPPGMKALESGDFARAWGGVASLQLLLSAMWTGARARGFGIEEVSRWLSAAPARLAGIDGFKGRIAPGFDADLVFLDPEAAWTVDAARLNHRHKITPYHGRELRGTVAATMVRGTTAFTGPRWPAKDSGGYGLRAEASGRWTGRTRR